MTIKKKYTYKAFISYAHADKADARRIHLRLETFRTPKQLIDTQGRWGAVGQKLTPVFRDRDELATGSALGPELQRALKGAEFLLVLCSPASANSHWVNEEIRYFRSVHGDDRVLAAIIDGEPGGPVGNGFRGCFPPAMIAPPEGSTAPREPIAADFRKDGDGKRLAFLKIAAGMLGVGLDGLVQRYAMRRQRRMAQIAAASLAGMALTSGLAVYAYSQRNAAIEQRAIAETERDTATASLDYLVSIFEIANPATENPKTITALTILERGRKKLAVELADQPGVQAKLMQSIGSVYANLGEIDIAKETLEAAINNPAISVEDRLDAEIELIEIYGNSLQLDEARAQIAIAESLLVETALTNDLSKEYQYFIQGLLSEQQARIAVNDAKPDDAIGLYENAKELLTSSGKDVRHDIARISTARGLLLSRTKDLAQAEQELNRAKTIALELFGTDHLDTARATHNLAFFKFNANQLDTASELMAEAVAIYDRVLEENHPTNSHATLLLGRIHQAKGDYAKAVRSLDVSMKIAKNVFGEDNEVVGFRLLYLALAQAEARQYQNAIASLDEAQAIYDENFEPGDFNHGDIMVYRAIVLGKSGQKPEALELCGNGLAILRRNLPAEHSYLAEMVAECAKIRI